jgi:D-alanyl-D-alanine carboxypeptidase
MIPTSKAITHTLAGASITSALLLMTIYGMQAPLHQPVVKAAEAPKHLDIDPETLTARAAIVYDPVTKEILFAKNADARVPLASLTKLMSADAVLAGTNGNDQVTITKEDLSPEGDWGFRVGETWRLSDLIHFGLVASSNDAMAAAASALSGNAVDQMNIRAKELGLTQTYFYNPTGLDLDVETAGAYGSAHDVAVLAAAFLEQFPAQFEATAVPSVSITSPTHTLEATSTALPLLGIPGLIGAKTGYTDLAGGNLVAAFDIEVGRPLIIAVLGSTREGRFEDVKTLINLSRRMFGTHQ